MTRQEGRGQERREKETGVEGKEGGGGAAAAPPTNSGFRIQTARARTTQEVARRSAGLGGVVSDF